MHPTGFPPVIWLCLAAAASSPLSSPPALPHGTVISPMSRVYRVYQSNPQNPNFPLAAAAVAIDGALSYYTWNEVSRDIPQAVQAGLPPGFDYSPWMPDSELASAGRVNPNSPLYPRTYAGLDQVSAAWPTTPVTAGQVLPVSFLATAAHSPSVWDVWMTSSDWDASTALRWSHMEFLGRPSVTFTGTHYDFNITVPTDRLGHHVLWVAWQRNDPAGEVFISTSDIQVRPRNDECDGAEPIALGQHADLTLDHATPGPPTGSCESSGGADVWFEYTAQCSGTLRVDSCATTGSLDTAISIWSGSCGALTEIGCDDDGCGGALSAATANVTAATTYYIKVAAQAAGTAGQFDLAVSFDNGTGSITATSPGCGAAIIQATGAPNIGGIVDYQVVSGTGSVQALVYGFSATTAAMCNNCTIGVNSVGTMPGHTAFVIPCDPGLVGVQWWIQGVDAFGTVGGCNLGGGVDFTLTDSLRTAVGS